jgi:DNA-binding XRE family transcriptional regulator
VHRPSPGDHGRSELRDRPAIARSLRREQRLLAERMRTLRQERGWTQQSAAAAIGVSLKQLQRVELGQANVTLTTLLACALVYGVELRDLFAGDEG